MTWNSIMAFISSVILFLPIVLILVSKLGGYRTFPALLSYYFVLLAYNVLVEHLVTLNPDTVYYWTVCKNLLDGPLMLTFLAYFSSSALFMKKLKVGLAILVCFEITVVIMKGISTDAMAVILGPVWLTLFIFSGYLFIRQTKLAILNGKATGKAVIAASIFFAYGCYMIIYIMFYLMKTQYVADTYLIYYIITMISTITMCAGICIEKKRIQKLAELKLTRKELSDIYKDTNTTTPIGRVVLDFDKDQWN